MSSVIFFNFGILFDAFKIKIIFTAMKKIFSLLIGLCLVSQISFAQQNLMESEVPPQSSKAFHEKYPEAVILSWIKSDSDYHANYKLDDEVFDAYFSADGQWLRTESTIYSEDLPDAIINYKKSSKYKSWDIGAVKLIETPTKGKTYKIEMYDLEYNQAQLIFDAKGNIVNPAK